MYIYMGKATEDTKSSNSSVILKNDSDRGGTNIPDATRTGSKYRSCKDREMSDAISRGKDTVQGDRF